MKYWLGLSKLSVIKNKIVIASEDGFTIEILLKEDEKFSFNKCLDSQILNCEKVTITKCKNLKDQKQAILGFPAFMTNIGLLLKRHIINNKIKKYNLNDFYTNMYNIIKNILGE
jgi:hypothetical protein